MTIVVTGAAGHIGGVLVRKLLERGEAVRVSVLRDRRALEGLDVERVQGDLLDPGFARELVDGASIVYHLAARISIFGGTVDGELRVNVEGTRAVVNACRDAGVDRLVHFSSIHALRQQPLDQPLDDDRPLADSPKDLPYDRSKAAGQHLVEEAADGGLDAVVVNPAAVMGPLDFKPSHIGQMVLDLCGRRIPALVPRGYTWVDVRDVADAAIRAAEVGERGQRFLLAGEYVSLPDLAAMVGRLSGRKMPRLVAPMWLAQIGAPFVTAYSRLRGTRPLFTRESLRILNGNSRMRSSQAKAALGFSPRPMEETVRDTLSWFDQAGMLDA